MDQRIQPSGRNPEFIGAPGTAKNDNRDGNRRRHPTSDDGTLMNGARFTDLDTGERWYFDGEGWYRMKTGEERILEELVKTRVSLLADTTRMIGLLEEMRDALMKIA